GEVEAAAAGDEGALQALPVPGGAPQVDVAVAALAVAVALPVLAGQDLEVEGGAGDPLEVADPRFGLLVVQVLEDVLAEDEVEGLGGPVVGETPALPAELAAGVRA